VAGVAYLIWTSVSADAMGQRRVVLNETIQQTGEIEYQPPSAEGDIAGALDTVVENGHLWRPVVTPRVAPPEPPNLAEKLKGVQPRETMVGQKVRIATPGNPRGEFYGVGDMINGTRIERIADGYVVFAVTAHGQTYTHNLPRKGR
jgi:hypothetical protein